MRRLGILGGMGPASTVLYYETLCAMAREHLGGNASADIVLRAVNFAETQAMQEADDWQGAGERLSEEAKRLEAAGAEAILLATNTMHKCADAIISAVSVPFFHIADCTRAALDKDQRKRPALLGTRYTMEEDFIKTRLGADIMTPGADDRAIIQAAIFDHLVKGKVPNQVEQDFMAIASRLRDRGADSLVLGCTEIGLVLNDQNAPLSTYDTARLHCSAAMEWALS